MAMFEIKDSEDINLKKCHTDASVLVKGENLKRLEVEDSSAFSQQAVNPAITERSLLQRLSKHGGKACMTIFTTLVAAFLAWWFGWTK